MFGILKRGSEALLALQEAAEAPEPRPLRPLRHAVTCPYQPMYLQLECKCVLTFYIANKLLFKGGQRARAPEVLDVLTFQYSDTGGPSR